MKPPVFDPNWNEEIRSLYRHDMQEIWDPSISCHIWNQYHNQLDRYLALAPDSATKFDILDVGCAQGTLALMLAERGHRVTAVDLRQSFLDYAMTRYTHGDIKFVSGNVLDMELPERFDLIFANQIVEHLVYPAKMVAKLKTMLKPGGRLVVTTPNHDYFRNSLPSFSELGDPAQYEDRQFTADGDGHFFSYRGEELKQIFEGEAMAEVEIRLFETPFISGHARVRHLHGLLPAGALRALDRVLLATPVARRFAHQLMLLGRRP
jgi:2-polyprenyl-3-methyl-5-hydroxy-6-metoxy-1,4-benzoquinol methylase